MKTGKDKGGSDWTLEQRQAIDWKDSHVLVSAGAGSGKTRVLVERIIEKITDENNPEEIDKFLVVTFTNAAAAEMKHRIHRALEDSGKIRPKSAHLRRQQMILNRASICTIHSFCMEVMKQYYYLLDLDPSFRIVDQTEGDLLRQEVLEQVMEEYYLNHEEKSSFYSLVEAYSSDRGDGPLKELVLKMYEFSRSHPSPRQWLLDKVEIFRVKNLEDLEQSSWVNILLKDTGLELEGMIQQLSRAETLCNEPGGPIPYMDNILKEKEMIVKSLEASRVSWGELYSLLQYCDFERLKGCKGDAYEQSLKEKVKQLRDKVKDSFKKLQEEIFQCSLEEYAGELGKMASLMEILVDLVLSYEKAYTSLKRERGLVDFSDLEHCTLQILGAPNHHDGAAKLTEAARYYQDKFNHVMVDEYQDINLVQEAIIKRVSREEGVGGNLFMVGDVKQSIYRFRLAEPGLFLEKLGRYKQTQGIGKPIILNKNFRSRKEVLEGVNYLFRQIMDEAVGEMDYDKEAELTSGIVLCPSSQSEEEVEFNNPEDFVTPEIVIISKNELENNPGAGGNLNLEIPKGEEGMKGNEDTGEGDTEELEELENALMEGRYIAEKIKEYTGQEGKNPVQFFCKKEKRFRPVTYRDMVILLRSSPNWTSIILEELQRQDIPAYGEQRTGYFQAVEVEVMLSLLRVIDNPYQDIPLAAVLRSPLTGLSAEEMAIIRAENMEMSFYDALKNFNSSTHYDLKGKIQTFLIRLKKWQSFVHRGELGELIWQIYQETRYYDLMGGMEGGLQRQANLRALYDRARQYEATSFRGLFRFLRFIEKLRDMGGDLGAARTLGEQENVVRIMTIHKSKGLEFPIVFLAGLGRQFNRRDLHGDFLLHKKLGFGPKRVDMERRVIYPTLPFLAVKKRLGMEMLAEEMRVLYVALTRAEEKLIMVGTVNDLCKETIKWSDNLLTDEISKEVCFSSYARASAKSYLDWVGPSILSHPAAEKLRDLLFNRECILGEQKSELSKWKITLLSRGDLKSDEKLKEYSYKDGSSAGEWLEKIKKLEPVPLEQEKSREINKNLSWRYPFINSAMQPVKMTVSELKNRHQELLEGDSWPQHVSREKQNFSRYFTFPKTEDLTPVERGMAYHTIMQNIDLGLSFTKESIYQQLNQMVGQGILSLAGKELVNTEDIIKFFSSPLGERMKKAQDVYREVPFTLSVPPSEMLSLEKNKGHNGELLLFHQEDRLILQGVVDCILVEKEGLVIIDYKSDDTSRLSQEALKKKYHYQLTLYGQAVEKIWRVKVVEKYLYFFNGGFAVPLE